MNNGKVYINKWIKSNARHIIAEEFKDNVTDFDDKEISTMENQKESDFIDIEKVKKDTDDVPSNIFQTIIKAGTLIFGIGKSFAQIFGKAVPVIGSLAGMIINGKVIEYDLDKYLEFYGKRLIYKNNEQ